jgi:hypothetical protein
MLRFERQRSEEHDMVAENPNWVVESPGALAQGGVAGFPKGLNGPRSDEKGVGSIITGSDDRTKRTLAETACDL